MCSYFCLWISCSSPSWHQVLSQRSLLLRVTWPDKMVLLLAAIIPHSLYGVHKTEMAELQLLGVQIFFVHCFQMCSKEMRETPGADHGPTAVAAPARFDSKPAFRQAFAKPEVVKWVSWQRVHKTPRCRLVANLCSDCLSMQWRCEEGEPLCARSASPHLPTHPQAWRQAAAPSYHQPRRPEGSGWPWQRLRGRMGRWVFILGFNIWSSE